MEDTPFGAESELIDDFLAAAGGEPANAVWARVLLDGGEQRRTAWAFRVIGASPEAMWAGADAAGLPTTRWPEDRKRAVPFPGWEVVRVDEPGDNVPQPTWVAVRGDRLVWLGSWPEDEVTAFLEAIR